MHGFYLYILAFFCQNMYTLKSVLVILKEKNQEKNPSCSYLMEVPSQNNSVTICK